jgi:hypothetical protein
MTSRSQKLLATVVVFVFGTALLTLAADKPQSFTGKVSDAMCGAHHMMAGAEADCTRACVGKGSKYSLVVGDKVYTLDTDNKAALGSLDKLAGSNAKVTGTLNGDTIAVASVTASK